MQLDYKDDAHTVAGNLGVDDMVRIAPKAVTHNIDDCTAVIVNNGEAGTEGHFIPTSENLDSNDVENALKEDAAKLAQDSPASVLILGGEAHNPDSRRLHEKIQNAVASTGLPKSEIWGRKEGINTMKDEDDEEGDIEGEPRMRAMFNAVKRTNYLAVDNFDDITSLKGLAYYYEEVNFSAPDFVEAQGKLLTAQQANEAVAKYKAGFDPTKIVSEDDLNKPDSP